MSVCYQVVELQNLAGGSDSRTSINKWLSERADQWVPRLRTWCPNKELLMVAYDNYQKNVKNRRMMNGKSGTFFNGTMRVFIKAIGVDESLSKTGSIKPLAQVTSDDVSGICRKGRKRGKLKYSLCFLLVPRFCPTSSALSAKRPA